MTSTRVTTIVTFLLATAGLSLLVLGESPMLAVAGAALTVAAAMYLTRHFWREAGKKSERLARASKATLELEMTKQSTEITSATDSLRGEIAAVSRRVDVFSKGVLEYVAQLELDTKALVSDVSNVPERLSKVIDVDRRLKRQHKELLTDVAGVVGVYSILRPRIPYPPFGGWAVDGECARQLVTTILADRPSCVVETGSGLSTILAAQAMDLAGIEGPVISLEHETHWAEETRRAVEEHGVGDRCRIVLAPLTETTIDGESFQWYDLDAVELPDQIGMLFVDGPPEATGPMARYPAVPLLYDRLTVGAKILLDDAARPGERDAVERWTTRYPSLRVTFKPGPKGTAELTKARQ